jgi:thiamine-phosphate pyrophosphorylase
MRTLDLGLYLVTDAPMCAARGLLETVEAAIAGGVTVVQLRDPQAGGRELYETARQLGPVLRRAGVPLIVNDRADVALAAGADGVHVGQSDMPVEAVRRLTGPDFIVGLSVSDAQELQAANALPAGTVDYLGVGPVFATPTKPDASVPVGIDGLAELVAGAALRTVAIGGVSEQNAAAVRATGVDGLCVVSAICAADDPRAAAARLASEVSVA